MTGRIRPSDAHRLVAVLAAVLLAGSTAACYTYSGARYGGPDAPLQARLASAHDGRSTLNFAVSDRAHVALFKIYDSGYARALYPYHPGSTSTFGAGAHTVLATATSPRGGWGWRSTPAFARGHRAASRCSGFGRARTTYALLVASRSPLRVDRIRGDVPFRYRSGAILATPFYRGTAFGSMDLLLDRLIPRGLSREDWDVDWVVATEYVGSDCSRWLRSPFLRRIAKTPDPPDDDTSNADTRPRRLDTGDLPFSPPRIPVDLPEVAVTGSDGSSRIRVPLPPVAVTPVPRPAPEGKRRRPAVEGLEGIGEERPGREPRDAGPESVDGPSDHFGRLFDDGGPEAEGWIPGRSERRGRAADRRRRDWARDLNEWASNPSRHDFPEPPRSPTRWRERDVDWPSMSSPGRRIGDRHRDVGDVQRIDPPSRSPRGRDIEVRRPPSSSDRGGSSDARKSGGGSKDRGGH